jgi:hypothetical protein
MEECSETSAYTIQTPGNYPEESIKHLEQGESLKSRIIFLYTLIMQAAGSPATSAHFYRTVLYRNPLSSIPHIRRSYNRKPQTSGLHDASLFSLLQAEFSVTA